MNYPKITIVTPSYNQVAFLEATILSVLNQNYPNLEYILIDGGSTDGSVKIIQKYEKYISYWVSEPDKGLYDALQKGFSKATGEIMGWLNSDDMLHPKSLFVIADIFYNNPSVKWVQGLPCAFDELGRTVLTRAHRSEKFSFYMKDYHDSNFIQQESTYWHKSLWIQAGGYISQQYKYAGDFELWIRFFRTAKLYNTDALIGGFRVRQGNQLSIEHRDTYFKEADEIIDQEIALFKLERPLKRINAYRKYLSKVLPLRTFLKEKYDTTSFKKHTIFFDFSQQIFRAEN